MIRNAKLFTLFIVITSILIGCQPANKPPANQSAPPPGQKISYTERVKQTAPEPRKNQSSQAISRRMVQIATQMPQVRNATAISVGKYTLVGIDVDPTLDRGRVGTVKYTVAQALREDPQGANALVTADVDIVQRIRELNEDLRNGRPIGGIVEELADIAGRITPQPSKEVKKKEQNKNQMNQQKLNH